MKVIKKSTKNKIYSIRLTEGQLKITKELKKDNIDLPEMIRLFIEDTYKNHKNIDQDDLYLM